LRPPDWQSSLRRSAGVAGVPTAANISPIASVPDDVAAHNDVAVDSAVVGVP